VNDFTGRVVVVTGASTGIGLAAATAFARGHARVALVARDSARLEQALSAVRESAAAGADAVTAFPADFTRFDDVRSLAIALGRAYPRIDVLANNAGGAYAKRATTADGLEQTIQINHLSPFLLTNLLRDRLDGARIINTASTAHRMGRLDPANLSSDGRPYSRFPVYGASKLANIVFAVELARRWPEVFAYSFHPGVVRSRFGNDGALISTFYKYWPFIRSAETGADTMLWLAAQPTADLVNGGYYADRRLTRPIARATDAELGTALWDESAKIVGL
jgi:daunorubicin C-13 ketoreductase